MIDPERECRAYALLQWVPYSLSSDFEQQLAEHGAYSTMQKHRSDKALDDFEQAHPYTSSPELEAFRELERLGVYNQSNFYSPSKAKCGHYSERLKRQSERSGSSGHVRTLRGFKTTRRPRGWSYG